jgi:hypothetical protein
MHAQIFQLNSKIFILENPIQIYIYKKSTAIIFIKPDQIDRNTLGRLDSNKIRNANQSFFNISSCT